ncbi:holo-ACP synthase [Paenarthrobacter nicotinovorans]|uniref:holo-ACP synthase n=1 Tax=Paenarthrobacter nicotinovorans TaxID=29320 RepID=UPI003D6FA596
MTSVVGIDAVDIQRIARMLALSPQRFAAFAWTEAERSYCRDRPDRYATRWAAKEAVMKALGTGFATLDPLSIEVVTVEDRIPMLRLTGEAAAEARRQHISTWAISLTHEGNLALAVVMGTGRNSHE